MGSTYKLYEHTCVKSTHNNICFYRNLKRDKRESRTFKLMVQEILGICCTSFGYEIMRSLVYLSNTESDYYIIYFLQKRCHQTETISSDLEGSAHPTADKETQTDDLLAQESDESSYSSRFSEEEDLSKMLIERDADKIDSFEGPGRICVKPKKETTRPSKVQFEEEQIASKSEHNETQEYKGTVKKKHSKKMKKIEEVMKEKSHPNSDLDERINDGMKREDSKKIISVDGEKYLEEISEGKETEVGGEANKKVIEGPLKHREKIGLKTKAPTKKSLFDINESEPEGKKKPCPAKQLSTFVMDVAAVCRSIESSATSLSVSKQRKPRRRNENVRKILERFERCHKAKLESEREVSEAQFRDESKEYLAEDSAERRSGDRSRGLLGGLADISRWIATSVSSYFLNEPKPDSTPESTCSTRSDEVRTIIPCPTDYSFVPSAYRFQLPSHTDRFDLIVKKYKKKNKSKSISKERPCFSLAIDLPEDRPGISTTTLRIEDEIGPSRYHPPDNLTENLQDPQPGPSGLSSKR